MQRAIENLRDDHPGSLDDETEEIDRPSDNHLADTATATLDREIDYTLEENSEQVLAEIDAALAADRGRHVRHLHAAARRSREERLEAHPWATLCIDDARQGGARVSEPARRLPPLDVRVGSSTDGLAPVSVAERSLAAGAAQWLALAAIALAAVAADQLTKHIVTSQLALDDGVHVVGPFWIHHVQNSGIAFGLFASATAVVIVADRRRRRVDARLLRALRRAPSRSCRWRSGS